MHSVTDSYTFFITSPNIVSVVLTAPKFGFRKRRDQNYVVKLIYNHFEIHMRKRDEDD